ncbi:MAG: DNA adenine methylase [Nanoarchaeota archaeon]|nr:DNA adenine methylase [Nanoarchaeota archaeon]
MISWIGGKSKISKWIIPFIPKDVETYVEPMSGAFWVYLTMDLNDYKNLNTIVYNDYNKYLTNLFVCCKEHEYFSKYIKDIKVQDEKLFYEFQNDLNKYEDFDIPDYDNALKFSYLTTQVFSGISPLNGKFIDLKGKYKSKFDTFRDKLVNKKFTDKLDKITNFENLDFEECIKKYDSEKTFNYVDAPYYRTEHYYSNHDFGLDDHKRLADTLKSIKGKFAMSYYYFGDLEKWFPKDKYRWESKDFVKAASAKSGIKQNKGTELLIMNY